MPKFPELTVRPRRHSADVRVVSRAIWREQLLAAVRQLGGLDLSFTQLATLLELDAEGEVAVHELAATLGRSLSATSRLVDGLVRMGLVARDENPDDRRAKRVTLAEPGRRLIARMDERRKDHFARALETLSVADRALVDRAFALVKCAMAERPGRLRVRAVR